jgi:single-strand DNA-binding protein
MYLNRLTLIGFTGGDAETNSGNHGSTFTVFSVARKRSWKNADGEWESRTEWHRCLALGKLGDFAAGLKKGAHGQVEGELCSREYDNAGVKHKVFECRLESILKLDRAARREEPRCRRRPGRLIRDRWRVRLSRAGTPLSATARQQAREL